MSAPEEKKRGLGRGLSALFGEVESVSRSPENQNSPSIDSDTELKGDLKLLPIDKLHPSPYQPRRVFDEEAIQDLVESVREKGVLQPLLVRRDPDNNDLWEIIAGERRWRAAQAAALYEVPVIIREMDNQEALEVALIENLQRQDLTPLEEAEGYRRLQEEFSHTQEELARTVGKSRSHVANMMRLLSLPESVKMMLDRGDLTAGHARALLTSGNPSELASMIATKGLNVRQTEKLVQKIQKEEKESKAPKKNKESLSEESKNDLQALEQNLSQLLGVKVSVKLNGKGGEISIHYDNLEQLDAILHSLTQGQGLKKVESEEEEKQEIFED